MINLNQKSKKELIDEINIISNELNSLKEKHRELEIQKATLEIKLNEHVMSQNYRHLQIEFNNLQEGYFQTDIDGNIIFLNTVAAEMYGYEQQELIGKHASILFSKKEDSETLIKELRKSGKLTDYITRDLKNDGTPFWVSKNVQFAYSEQGEIIGIQAFIRDVNERFLAEDKLRIQSELLDLAPASILIHDLDANIIYVNKKTISMHGYSDSEFKAIKIQDLDTTESAALISSRMQKLMEEGSLSFEVEHKRKDGSVFPLIVHAKVINWGDKQVVMSISEDITFRKQVDTEIKNEVEKFRNITATSPDFMFVTRLSDGQVLYANQQAKKVIGLPHSEIINHKTPDFYADPSDRQKLLTKLLEHGEVNAMEILVKRADGSVFWSLINARIGTFGNEKSIYVSLQDISERKKAENILIEYKTAVEQSADGIALADMNGKLSFINKTFAQMHGYSPEELVGRHLSIFHTPEQLENEVGPFNQKVLTEGSNRAEIGHVHKDGTVFPTEMIVTLIKNTKNEPQGMLAICRDITKRREIEQKLIESENKYRSIFENIQDAFFQADKNGLFTIVSPSVKNMYGFTGEELIGKPAGMLYADMKSREILLEKLHKDKGKTTDYITKAIKKDGTSFWVSMNVQYVYDKEGKIIGTQGVVRDISERVKYEDALKKSEMRFKAISEQAMDGISLTDINGRYIFVNQAFCNITGYSESELLTMSVYELKPKDNDVMLFEKTKLQGFGSEQNVKLKCKDGSVIFADINAKKITPDNEESIMLGIVRDVTERVKKENELIKAKNKAEESDRFKTAFLLNLSHEIRTPMNGILGFTGLLTEPDLNESDKSNYINIIKLSGERLMSTINDLVEISKIEIGDISLKHDKVNLKESMEFYLNLFRIQAEEKGLKLAINQQLTGQDACVITDKNKLDSIMMNLVKNALKFTNSGKIEIGNYLNNDKLCFYVSDTGIGIPEEYHKKIFEQFVQVESGLNRTHEGSGIGLSIVKSYVDALNGTIEVKSKSGEGSTFIVSVPYTPVYKKMKISEEIYSEEPREMKSTLLIAEDDEINYLYIENVLAKDFNLIHAFNGEESVQIFSENPHISAVLMDVKMPGSYDGLEAIRKIREINKRIPIIAQTAFTINADKKKALEAGCNEYISKPFKKDELIALIKKTLNL